jgi:3-deoxy-D-arabino-heptulosonate 7-phosphate (DAHP) synthase
MIAAHDDLEAALFDGEQALLPDNSESLVAQMPAVAAAIGRGI